MSRREDNSSKIIKILANKPALPVDNLEYLLPNTESQTKNKASKYALTRSLKGLEKAGLVEKIHSGNNDYARLTREGKKKYHSLKLDQEDVLLDTNWDGYWRIILLDLPEDRKAERESLRYLLKKANFVCLKNSAWISPYPFEHLFTNIKKDLGLSTELIIIKTDSLDEITEKELYKIFNF